VTVLAGMLGLGAGALAGAVAVLLSTGGGEPTRLGNLDPIPVVTAPVSSLAETPAPAEYSGGASPLVSDPVPTPAEVAGGGSDAQAPPLAPSQSGPADAAASANAVVDGELAGAPGPSGGVETANSWAPPAADAIPPSEPAATTDQEPEQVAMLVRAEPELPTPVVLPPVERRSIPPVAQTASRTVGAAEAAAGLETIDSQPNATVVAELEEVGLMAQAMATDLTRRRDLLAADLALAQGRLTSPPERSAYALYNRVLTQDPGSPEATSGLQSVREELINRALAQLAGGELDDARRTLQAAADAGVDLELIADLRNEVDSR
jgi:hypothetical protein